MSTMKNDKTEIFREISEKKIPEKLKSFLRKEKLLSMAQLVERQHCNYAKSPGETPFFEELIFCAVFFMYIP